MKEIFNIILVITGFYLASLIGALIITAIIVRVIYTNHLSK